MIKTISTAWHECVHEEDRTETIPALEGGEVIYFPQLDFELLAHEKKFLDESVLALHAKNVSYDSVKKTLKGTRVTGDDFSQMQQMIHRFVDYATRLLSIFMRDYVSHIEMGRTSFRPAEIAGRITSPRKDDTRLHVDAFPATPNQGKRILRVFSNINPHGQPRVWKLGEPFEAVARKFLPTVKKQIPGSAWLMEKIGLTKSLRTFYDHAMLTIHDNMKLDAEYQQSVPQHIIEFAAGSTWIVQTDHVSHAALRGQFVLEQTFYLPVRAMKNTHLSPLRTLHRVAQANSRPRTTL